jgi:hypothetical protein
VLSFLSLVWTVVIGPHARARPRTVPPLPAR